LYLELVGHHQEEIDASIDRLRALYAQESTRPRAFDIKRAPEAYRGTVYSQRHDEIPHVRPHGLRLRRILRDQPTTPEDRHNTLTHLLEFIAVLGLNEVMDRFVLPSRQRVKCVLAPEPLEVGSPYPHGCGADILVSYGEREVSDPYPVTCGIDVKSAIRSYRHNRPQYSDRIGAPTFDVYVGGWRLTRDGRMSLHDGVWRAITSNDKSKEFIRFMEKNIQPFGMYLAHQFASAVFEYENKALRFGHLRVCNPELACMFPRDEVSFKDQMCDIGQLTTAFRTNGIRSIWYPAYLQAPNLHHQFLPTTPLQ